MSMSDTEYTMAPVPNADMEALGLLVGTWRVSGGTEGMVSYRWMDGGFFLIQEVELTQYGQTVKGLEIIGHLKSFGQEEDPLIRSRFYDAQGNTFDYVYELNGQELTIWAGEKGSPAFFKGTFSPDGSSNAGAWTYPDGGGYESLMTKAE